MLAVSQDLILFFSRYYPYKENVDQLSQICTKQEGGEYEHLALVEALHTILVNVEKLKPEVDRLLKVLAQFFFDDLSVRLATCVADFQSLTEASVARIWPSIHSSTGSEAAADVLVSNVTFSFDRLRLGPNATANSIVQSYSSSDASRLLHPDRMDFHLLPPHLQHPPSAMTLNGGRGREEEFRMDILARASGAIVHRSKKEEK